jgi:hypothetical protein
MPILFDFHPDSGDVQPVTVHADDDATFEMLRRCADGEADPLSVVTLTDCEPQGADRGEFIFRAGKIRNVRRA